MANAERNRLDEAAARGVPWRRWGPYLSERQWATNQAAPEDLLLQVTVDFDEVMSARRGEADEFWRERATK